ncbi:DUF3040 domain-containing protein [Streptomyces sp. 8L]|uniref:DUF3040 domain-containing protein n=1 Tax=Streptomyces sp. 8L TaxID=2877242 RepID=UPI001CD7F83B|nr:DUF3040 domain-containing protein [Streptomyces sp. 8L]MCA1218080.1 DUF3040 domain-containing protein [Streptomyces sp. 8L]
MGLSEHERRELDRIERRLSAEEPVLDRQLSHFRRYLLARLRRPWLGVLIGVAATVVGAAVRSEGVALSGLVFALICGIYAAMR